MPRSLVVDHAGYDWEGDTQLHRRSVDSVLYEVHVKGFTAAPPGHPAGDPRQLRGPRARGRDRVPARPRRDRRGAAAGARVRARGLPRHPWPDQLLGLQHHRLLRAAPGLLGGGAGRTGGHSAGGQVNEFKDMVKALHRAGIEVILDVVYNHTAEGNENGPTLSFRGLDNAMYYRLGPDDASKYYDTTGTGNSLNAGNPATLRLIMDSLRYWMSEMHVDGFRFDLAATLGREGDNRFDQYSAFFEMIAQDPVIGQAKLIAEPWDVGQARQLRPWAVPRGVAGVERPVPRLRCAISGGRKNVGVAEFATRFSGSSDLYGSARRRPTASVNLITVHDGFTLRDLVSYDAKHNEANGEDNRDGTERQPLLELRRGGSDRRPVDQRAARTPVTGDAVHAAAVVRPAAAARRRRDRPHPGR